MPDEATKKYGTIVTDVGLMRTREEVMEDKKINLTKFFLSNTTKKAENWGFNLRIKANRNGAAGDCYVVSAGKILNERKA